MCKYQPLRIIADWQVMWNTFMETDPKEDNIEAFSDDALLVLNSVNRLRSIDLCWSPEGDIQGQFEIQVLNLYPNFNPITKRMHYEADWETPHSTFRSKNRLEIVAQLEKYILELSAFHDPRILSSPGVVNQPMEKLRIRLEIEPLSVQLGLEIIKSEHKVLQDMLIDHQDVNREMLENLVAAGTSKGVKNKAKQKLNSKRFLKR